MADPPRRREVDPSEPIPTAEPGAGIVASRAEMPGGPLRRAAAWARPGAVLVTLDLAEGGF